MNRLKIPVKHLVGFSGLALATVLSQNLFAASTITAPDEIIVIGINDQAIKSSLLKKSKEYKVDPGALSINVRYQAYFEDNLNQHDIVKSDVLRLEIPQIQDNQRYVLKLIDAPKNHDEAKEYAEQPKIALFDQNNQQVVQNVKMSSQPRNSILGGLLSDSVDVTQVRTTPISQNSTLNQAPNPQSEVTQAIASNSHAQSLDQEMIQLWQKASTAERQKFMNWLGAQ